MTSSELGLSHIINTEGEKLQYAMGTIPEVTAPEKPATIGDLLALNNSVCETLDSTMQNQMFLNSKLKTALSASVMRGHAGPVGTILDSFKTLDELENTHLTGSQGDAYLVAGELYVWDTDNRKWKSVGNLIGPSGPEGPQGKEGPQGPSGTLEPELILFNVTGTKGDEDVTFEGEIAFESKTLDISVEPGPVIKIENPKRNSTIIPFSSKEGVPLATATSGGGRGSVAALGFGNHTIYLAPTDPINTELAEVMAFSMPVDGTIAALSAYYASVSGGLVGVKTRITAQIYRSETPNEIFYKIDGAFVQFEIDGDASTPRQIKYDSKQLSIPVNANDRLLLVFYSETPAWGAQVIMTGVMSGGIAMELQ